jgi:hypothetical protein
MSVWDSWNTIFSRHQQRNVTYRHMINARTVNACAPQWLAGLAFSLNAAVFVGLTTVMLPPDMDMTSPLDRKGIVKIFQHTGAKSIVTPPSLIEDFFNDREAFDFLKSLEYVCWLGAGLDHKVGDVLTHNTHLFPVIGSTERGPAMSFESDDVTMWSSYEFIPEVGSRFEWISDDLYELQIDRTTEHDFFQCGFFSFPDRDSLNTDELYSPVIDKYGIKRWAPRGRKDDLVKLSWLAKFHATHIEDAISKDARVSSVIVGGEGRDVPYVIIEPKDQGAVADPDELIDNLYNTVIYGVNSKDNDEIRIPREMVFLSDPSLPFKRSMKMTVLRKEVEKAYVNHIEAAYKLWRQSKLEQTITA